MINRIHNRMLNSEIFLEIGDTVIFKTNKNGWLPFIMTRNGHFDIDAVKPNKIILIECKSSKKYNYTSSNKYD